MPTAPWPAVDALRDALADAARARPDAAARLRAALVGCQGFLDEELFPAMRESEAGSDAVCIPVARSVQYLAFLTDEPLAMGERLLA